MAATIISANTLSPFIQPEFVQTPMRELHFMPTTRIVKREKKKHEAVYKLRPH